MAALLAGRCNQLAPASSGLFQLRPHLYRPEKTKYVHTNCGGPGKGQPTALPARFLVACKNGHMDDFPWVYFVHKGGAACDNPTLSLTESGTTGEAANVFVRCTCGAVRSMADAIGQAGESNLPACRGHHPHLGTFAPGCDEFARTMVLGATNSWFASQLKVFSIPRAEEPLTQAVREHWNLLSPLAAVPAEAAKMLLPTQACWPELEQYGADAAWAAITREAQSSSGDTAEDEEEFDLITPEWQAFTHPRNHSLPDFTTVRERQVPDGTSDWLDSVVLVHRLREVSALTGFTRIEAPEWLPDEEVHTRPGAPSAVPIRPGSPAPNSAAKESSSPSRSKPSPSGSAATPCVPGKESSRTPTGRGARPGAWNHAGRASGTCFCTPWPTFSSASSPWTAGTEPRV